MWQNSARRPIARAGRSSFDLRMSGKGPPEKAICTFRRSGRQAPRIRGNVYDERRFTKHPQLRPASSYGQVVGGEYCISRPLALLYALRIPNNGGARYLVGAMPIRGKAICHFWTCAFLVSDVESATCIESPLVSKLRRLRTSEISRMA